METLRAIAALGAHEAGVADVARQEQPDACQGDAWLQRQTLNDGLEYATETALGGYVESEAQ
jgi:hypothetical protein